MTCGAATAEGLPLSTPDSACGETLAGPGLHSWQHHAPKDRLGLPQATLDLRDSSPEALGLRTLLLRRRANEGFEGPPVHGQAQW